MESSPGCLRGTAGHQGRPPTRLPSPWLGILTCRSGTLCTRGIATLRACGASGRRPGRSRGSAARSWCRRAGPAGRPARRKPRSVRPLRRREELMATSKAGAAPAARPDCAPITPSPSFTRQNPARTHLHRIAQVLRTQQPQRLHRLEGATGSSTGEVVEMGAGGRPARDGGPHPLTVFTFLQVEQAGIRAERRRTTLRDGSRLSSCCPALPQPQPRAHSPVRSLRKQLCPRRSAPLRPAPRQQTRLHSSGEPSSALQGEAWRVGTPGGTKDGGTPG